MSGVREPAVAGRFYPANPDELRAAIRGFLCAQERRRRQSIRSCRRTSLVNAAQGNYCPACGVRLLGSDRGKRYSALGGQRGRVRRVILFGPAHFVRLRGMAIPSATFSKAAGARAHRSGSGRAGANLAAVVLNDAAHAREHSLEVHVPFLQEVLGDFQVLPLAVGEVTAEEVSQVIELLWGGEETLFVVSSDLSHFHDYETAVRVDTETARLIESLRFEELTGERCCGFRPIGGMLEAARPAACGSGARPAEFGRHGRPP